jgi:hypothetical protein
METHSAGELQRTRLDAAFLHNIGVFLNDTLRPPKQSTCGADWPADENGHIPSHPHTRLGLNRDIYKSKTQSTTPLPPEDTRKTWLKQLMVTTGKFSHDEAEKIEDPITAEELARTYRSINSSSAPGPTGITYPQWTCAPPSLMHGPLPQTAQLDTRHWDPPGRLLQGHHTAHCQRPQVPVYDRQRAPSHYA